MLRCKTTRQQVNGGDQATHLRPVAPMAFDKQLLPPSPPLFTVCGALLQHMLKPSKLRIACSCTSEAPTRICWPNTISCSWFGFPTAASEKENNCCSVYPPKIHFAVGCFARSTKLTLLLQPWRCSLRPLTKQLFTVTRLKSPYVSLKLFTGNGKSAPLLSQTCVVSSALTRFVKNHKVQWLFLLLPPHWLSVLITNTNSHPWCTAKLAEVWGADSARAGGGRALPYASCRTLAEVRHQGTRRQFFSLPDRCTKMRQSYRIRIPRLRFVENRNNLNWNFSFVFICESDSIPALRKIPIGRWLEII